jgi:hypothetical protein
MRCQSQKHCVKKQFVILLSLVFVLSCKKSGIQPIKNELIGKWIYAAYNLGIAGPGQWRPAPPNQVIEFKSDGSFVTTDHFWAESQFQTLDSATIKFWPDATSQGFILMRYLIDTLAGELLMYPISPMCAEGCEYKYRRILID